MDRYERFWSGLLGWGLVLFVGFGLFRVGYECGVQSVKPVRNPVAVDEELQRWRLADAQRQIKDAEASVEYARRRAANVASSTPAAASR